MVVFSKVRFLRLLPGVVAAVFIYDVIILKKICFHLFIYLYLLYFKHNICVCIICYVKSIDCV